MTRLNYCLNVDRAVAHRLQVSIHHIPADPAGTELWLPDWIPGSYMIRNFSRHLSTLQAWTEDGQSVAVHPLTKSRWRLAPTEQPVTVSYEVYAWDLSVRSAHVDQHHAYFNGSSVFLAVAGYTDQPLSVTLQASAQYPDWRVATTLPIRAVDAAGFGEYEAADYLTLIDHPVEMGTFESVTFEAAGVPHELVVTGQHRGDLTRLAQDLSRICAAQIAHFGAPAPFTRYLFQLTVVDQGYGGLEHRDSTSLLCRRDCLPVPGVAEISDDYLELLGLCSHEYWHSWLVKRLQPAEFVQPDLQRENHTTLLWFFEGATSYFDDRFLLLAGVISPTRYLQLIARTLTRHLQTPGRFRQSVAQSSFDAWTKYYLADENSANDTVSYYVKGAVVALCLDLSLREHGRSLGNVLQRLWQAYLQGQRGLTEADVLTAVAQVGSEALAQRLSAWLHGTDELPWQELLTASGVTCSCLPVSRGTPWPAADLGVKLKSTPLGPQIAFLARDSAAEAAGLSVGDYLMVWDGLRLHADHWSRRLSMYQPGDTVEIHGFRRDEWFTTTCTLQAAACDTVTLTYSGDHPPVWLTE